MCNTKTIFYVKCCYLFYIVSLMLSMLTHLGVTGVYDLNFVMLLNGVDALGVETFFLCEWPASTVVELVQESPSSRMTTSLYRSRCPPRRRLRMIYPVQRSWEAVRLASMLDILARLKTSTFGM